MPIDNDFELLESVEERADGFDVFRVDGTLTKGRVHDGEIRAIAGPVVDQTLLAKHEASHE